MLNNSQKIILSEYLQTLIKKISDEKISDLELSKIYNILFIGMQNCELPDKNSLDCFALGFLLLSNPNQESNHQEFLNEENEGNEENTNYQISISNINV